MDERHRYLRIALIVVGIAFLSIYPLMKIWPVGWLWQLGRYEPGQTPIVGINAQMIVGVYATLGAFLLWASRKPAAHLSLIWFTIWSSVVHGLIMAVHAVSEPAEHGHLLGDVPALILVAIVLGFLAPREVVPTA